MRQCLQSLELIEQALRRAEVAHFDGRAHRFLKRLTLQLYRKHRRRSLDRAETFARLGPFALLRLGKRAP